jgi:oligopeptide transport system substrate-binding protein
MSTKKWTVLLAILVVGSLVLAACPAPEPQVVEKIVEQTVVVEKQVEVEKTVVVEKEVQVEVTPTPGPQVRPNVVRVNTGVGDIPSLDPNVAEDTTSITLIDNSFVGLTRLNEVTNELMPGMATDWAVSGDGKVYTYTLRTDVPWVKWDGEQVVTVQDCTGNDRIVNAFDFQYGILRALTPETASPYAYVLAFAIDGAADFNNGVITDTATVGVTAVDTTTLQIKTLDAVAYNPMIHGLWTAYATPKWLIEGDDCTEARAERWIEPGFFQSYGPYTLKEWIHDSTATLVKNPFWPGSDYVPQAQVDEIVFSMLDENAAMAEYETGNLDAVAVPLPDIDRVKADPTLSEQFVIAPQFCTYYYGFNTTAPFVDDPRMRRALSMSLDRQDLVDNVLKGGQIPAQWFARPGLVAAPTPEEFPDLGIKFDAAAAKAEMDAYLEEKGLTPDQLDITLMFNTVASHQKIAEWAQQQWKQNLGIDVKLTNQEWKVYLETIKGLDTPQLWRLGWCLDYPDANNFTREVMASNGSSNPTDEAGVPAGGLMWKNDQFEELVRQAAVEPDLAKRTELYAQAEDILVNTDAAIIPIYWYTRTTLTQPWVNRTFSLGGHEFYYNWSVSQEE